jgi:hypothetical protein
MGLREVVLIFFIIAVSIYGRDVSSQVGNASVLWSGAEAPSVVFVPGADLGAGSNYGPYVVPLMYAMNFSSTSYVSVTTSAVGTSDQLTVEAWIWPSTVRLGTAEVVSSACNGGGQWGVYINVTPVYSRPVTIYNPNPYPLYQFQVPIVVNTASLISQGKMRSDCGDLRFIGQNGTALPYYIEKESGVNCGSSTTWVWVRVPSIPAQGSATIYMTYGDTSAQSAESPDAVFDFWDSFDALNNGKWTILGNVNVTVSIANGVLQMSETGSSGYYQLKSNWGITFGYVVESRVYIGGFSDSRVAVPFIVSSPSGVVRYDNDVALGNFYAGVYLSHDSDKYGGFSFGVRLTNGSSTLDLKSNFYNPSTPLWAKTTVVFTKNSQIAYVYDDGWKLLATTRSNLTMPDAGYNIVIGLSYNKYHGLTFGWDWVRVRKFAGQMPNVTIGSEYSNMGKRVCVWTGWVTGVNRDRMCVGVSRLFHHVAAVYDRSTGAVALYGDGSLLAQWTVPIGAKPPTSGFRVGLDCNSSFTGYMRHVRVYNRALSASEIMQNYLSPDVPVTSGLAVWLAALDASSVSGSTWVDRAGGSSGGIVSGATYGQYGLFPPYTLELLYYAVPSPERYVYKVGREGQGFLVTHGDGCVNSFYVYGDSLGAYSTSQCGWVHAVLSVRPDGADVWINGARVGSIASNVIPATNPALWIYLNSTYTGRAAPPAYARISLYSGAASAPDQVKTMTYGNDPQNLRLLYKASFENSQYYAYAGSWDTTQMRGTAVHRVAGAYIDASGLLQLWHTPGFAYRRTVTVTNPGGSDLTNYQVAVTFNTASLISQGKMRSDCGDVRVYTSNGTKLPYWVEPGTCNTAATIVWVKVPYIPARGSTVLYIYYGNTGATSEASGQAVFEAFDDFSSNTLSQYVQVDSGWSVNTTAGWLVYGGSGQGFIAWQQKSLSRSYAVRARIYMSSADAGVGFIWGTAGGSEGSLSGYFANYYPSTSYSQLRKYPDKTTLAALPALSSGWYTVEVRVNATHIEVWRGGVRDAAALNTSYTTLNGVGFRQKAGGQPAVDWWALRKYTYPEPSASVGAEETAPTYLFYLGQQYSLGVSGKWTPSDNWRGWLTLFSAGGLWLNITQVGGHGVASPGQTVRGYAGTYALTYSGGVARLYANGTQAASWQIQLPTLQYPLTASLFSSTNSGLRAVLYYMWLSPGAILTPNGTSTCGTLQCTPVDHSAPYPQERSYFIDFRWWPPITSWGVIQKPPFTAVKQRTPSQSLVPVTLSGAYAASSQSAWGPFGEICQGTYGGQNYIYGVKYVWLSNDTPTCVLPLSTAPSTASPTFPVSGRFPPVQPWQHPALVNSVPRSEPWLVDYSQPYVDTSTAVATPYATKACVASFCIQSGKVVGNGYNIMFPPLGQVLPRTGYVYIFDKSGGVSVIENVGIVVPYRNYNLIIAQRYFLPGVTVIDGANYYNAYVVNTTKYAMLFPGSGYAEVGNVPMSNFTIVVVAGLPSTSSSCQSYLWRGYNATYPIYATLQNDGSTYVCIWDSTSHQQCLNTGSIFGTTFNTVVYVVSGGAIKVYVNGKQAYSASYSRRVDKYILRFGEPASSSPCTFYLYAAYVYTRVLTDQEIQSFSLESPPKSGLVAWYIGEPQFFTQGKWIDISGNNMHAAVTGSVTVDKVLWPQAVHDSRDYPAKWYIGMLPSGPPTSSVVQAISAIYVETTDNVTVTTWVPSGGSYDYKTGGYGGGVIPVLGYTGDMLTATAKVDLAVYGRYAFVIQQNGTHVYAFSTELSGSKLDIPIKVPYSGYYTVVVFYNGTKIRSSTYWIDQGGAVYLGTLGPPMTLIPIQPVQPQTATPIYNTGPLQPLNWLPNSLPLPAAVSSNPIEVSAAAALAVALAAAYVTYISSRRLELGIAAAIVAFFAVVSLLLPSDYRWMINGWVIFLVTVAMLLIVYYMTR